MKNNKILISILVPTYNRVKFLEECLDSIVSQEWFDLKELELIVSDNSEWDETKKFMGKYMEENKGWNIIYNKNRKNLWMVWNWNKLLELKQWDYFIFLSDDDRFYDENSLRILYDGLLEYKLDACYWIYNIDKDWIITGRFKDHAEKIKEKDVYLDNFNDQLFSHTICFWGVLYKSFWYKYHEWANYWADWNMNLQYLYGGKVIWLINKDTFIYRQRDSQLSNTSTSAITHLKTMLFNYDYFNISYYLRIKLIIITEFMGIVYRIKKIVHIW